MYAFAGFLVLGFVLATSFAGNEPREFLDLKKLEPLSGPCVKEQGMELPAFNDAVMNNTDEKDVKTRCALQCTFKSFIDKDGKAIPAEIEKVIPDQVLETSKDAVIEGFSKCLTETKNENKDDKECTLAKDIYTCGKEMMAKVDNVTETPKQ